MCPTPVSACRAALQGSHRKRVPKIVQTRAAVRRRPDPSPAHHPVEGLFDRNVAQRQTPLVDEHRIIVGTWPVTCQIAFQAGRCRVMQRHQSSLSELGLADQQAVVGHVGDRQLQGFGNPQSGGREQCDQGRIGC
jgi:hypothetical protein